MIKFSRLITKININRKYENLLETYKTELNKELSLRNRLVEIKKEVEPRYEDVRNLITAIFVHGPNDHRLEMLDLSKDTIAKDKARISKLNKKIQKQQATVDEIKDRIYKWLNGFGMISSMSTLMIMVAIIILMARILDTLNTLDHTTYAMILSAGENIDIKFYEATVQIIIALGIALFISKKHQRNPEGAKWWHLSKFASGVVCLLVGISICLFAIASKSTNIYLLILTVYCLITLLSTSLRPLVQPKI